MAFSVLGMFSAHKLAQGATSRPNEVGAHALEAVAYALDRGRVQLPR